MNGSGAGKTRSSGCCWGWRGRRRDRCRSSGTRFHGPLLNPNPTTQGVENLCNPRGRGIGPKPTGATLPTFDGRSYPLLDGFLWAGVPGRSHNSNCHPGDAPAGVFDPRFALELAEDANQKLGPGFPSQPY